jgi:purine-binding chemotaxis protein CheW
MRSADVLPRALSLEDMDLDSDDELADSHVRDGARQFVAFEALGEVYGIELRRVIEIAHSVKLTRLPGTPPFIAGIISLRGAVIPVVDLQAKFGSAPPEYGPRSGIIVVQIGERTVGVRATRVTRIAAFSAEQITPVPAFSSKIRTEFLQGLAREGEDLMIVLDIDRLLSEDELALVDAHGSDVPPEGAGR